jgi:hypothetical protein
MRFDAALPSKSICCSCLTPLIPRCFPYGLNEEICNTYHKPRSRNASKTLESKQIAKSVYFALHNICIGSLTVLFPCGAEIDPRDVFFKMPQPPRPSQLRECGATHIFSKESLPQCLFQIPIATTLLVIRDRSHRTPQPLICVIQLCQQALRTRLPTIAFPIFSSQHLTTTIIPSKRAFGVHNCVTLPSKSL